MFALGIICIEVWPTQMPVWCFVIALIIGLFSIKLLWLKSHRAFVAFAYIIPIGMIQAITNQQVGLKCVYSFYFSTRKTYRFAQRNYRTHHRLHASRKTDCDDDVQDMGIHCAPLFTRLLRRNIDNTLRPWRRHFNLHQTSSSATTWRVSAFDCEVYIAR